jgi:hypothetical protein
LFYLKLETQRRCYNRSKKVSKIVPAEKFPPIFCHLKSLKTQKKATQLGPSLSGRTQKELQNQTVRAHHATLIGGGNGKLYEQQTLHNFIGTWSTSASQEKLVPTFMYVIAT